jgi:hypothetical protein
LKRDVGGWIMIGSLYKLSYSKLMTELNKIAVSPTCFDRIKADCRGKTKRNPYRMTFTGDDFETRLWCEGDRVLAMDRSHPGIREVIAITKEEFKQNIEPISTKGYILGFMLDTGVPMDDALAACAQIKPLIDMFNDKYESKDDGERLKAIRQLCMLALGIATGKIMLIMD